jgi:hypothetical protein
MLEAHLADNIEGGLETDGAPYATRIGGPVLICIASSQSKVSEFLVFRPAYLPFHRDAGRPRLEGWPSCLREPASRKEFKAIIAPMLRWITCLIILCSGTVYGAVKQIPIRSGVVLQPGQAYTAQVESTKPVEIGFAAVQANPCTMDCIQITLVRDHPVSFSAARGARGNYTPTNGRLVVEYKNISQQSVTIDVFRIERSCEAEACKLFDSNKKGSWLVFKIDEFKSITNSTDTSYSVISGVAESGRALRIHVVWWTDQKGAGFMGCPRWIRGYVDNHTPKEKYRPYILSGMNVGDANNIVLTSIDDCVPLAPHFGVPEKNVFK